MPQAEQQSDRLNGNGLEETIEAVKTLIAKDLDVNIEMADIGNDISLLEKGLALDSVVIVELINLLEDRFSFHFSDEDMNPELFASVTALSEFVVSKRS
jgi:acyl carrier protein